MFVPIFKQYHWSSDCLRPVMIEAAKGGNKCILESIVSKYYWSSDALKPVVIAAAKTNDEVLSVVKDKYYWSSETRKEIDQAVLERAKNKRCDKCNAKCGQHANVEQNYDDCNDLC